MGCFHQTMLTQSQPTKLGKWEGKYPLKLTNLPEKKCLGRPSFPFELAGDSFVLEEGCSFSQITHQQVTSHVWTHPSGASSKSPHGRWRVVSLGFFRTAEKSRSTGKNTWGGNCLKQKKRLEIGNKSIWILLYAIIDSECFTYRCLNCFEYYIVFCVLKIIILNPPHKNLLVLYDELPPYFCAGSKDPY